MKKIEMWIPIWGLFRALYFYFSEKYEKLPYIDMGQGFFFGSYQLFFATLIFSL
jgi:hypothetical protein